MSIAKIFSSNRSAWSARDLQQVQYFFKCNKFYVQLYRCNMLESIIQMTYYAKVLPQHPVYLTNNKRSVVVVVLSGAIQVLQKSPQEQTLRRRRVLQAKQEPFAVKASQHIGFNSTVILLQECKVTAMHEQPAQIVYIPAFMHQKFLSGMQEERHRMSYQLLKQIFACSQKRPVEELAESGCSVEEYSIHNYVYRQGDMPQYLYVILEGSVKLSRQEDNVSIQAQQPYKPNCLIISARCLLGDKDLCEQARTNNAQCCSSALKLLRIPKEAFLHFAKHNLPQFVISKPPPKTPVTLKSLGHRDRPHKLDFAYTDPLRLPSVFRYKASVRSIEEDQKEYKLIRNSHILLDSSSPHSSRVRSKSSCDQYPKDIIKEKIKLFRKIRPNAKKLDLDNKII